MTDPIDLVKDVLGFPGYETAREIPPTELLDDAAQVLTAARIMLQGRAHRSDYRVHDFDRLVGLAEQIVQASS